MTSFVMSSIAQAKAQHSSFRQLSRKFPADLASVPAERHLRYTSFRNLAIMIRLNRNTYEERIRDERSRYLPQRNPRVARGQLPARNAPSPDWRGRHLLGWAPMEVQVRCATPLDGAHGGARLDGARMAPRVRRR